MNFIISSEVRLTRLEKLNFRRLLMKKLVFGPKELFDEAREDFWATSRVREARKYADGRTYLRVECRILKPDCTFEQPLQVLTLLDARRRIHGVPTDRKRVETLRKRAAEAEKMV